MALAKLHHIARSSGLSILLEEVLDFLIMYQVPADLSGKLWNMAGLLIG